MNNTTPQEQTSAPTRRRWLAGIGSLVLLGCCAWTGILGWFFAPLSPYWANLLWTTNGTVDVIAPAQWKPGAILAPGGRYMLVGWTKWGFHENFIWDLATKAQYSIKLTTSALCWFNNEQFIYDTNGRYFIYQASANQVMNVNLLRIEGVDIKPSEMEEISTRWKGAEKVYKLQVLGATGPFILIIEHGKAYFYVFNLLPREKLSQMLVGVSFVELPLLCNTPDASIPLYSPDGRFYTIETAGPPFRVQLFTRDHELVAETSKDGWSPRMMGWKYDSSGVYFQMTIRGGAASMMVPYEPVFFLRPSTPAERVWGYARWVLGGLAAAGGAAWWYVRRRRRRAGDKMTR